jgi:hypothetical protein
VSQDFPHWGLAHRRLEEEVFRLHEWRKCESSMLWGLADVTSLYRHSRYRSSRGQEVRKLVVKVPKSRDWIRAVHLLGTRGEDPDYQGKS